MVKDFEIRVLIPTLVLFLLALARRYAPAKMPKDFRTNDSFDALSARFNLANWVVYPSMAVIGLGLAWAVHSILVALNYFFAIREGPSDFVLLPQSAIWWFLPGFAALALSWDITLGAWALIGNKSNVALYKYWTSANVGYDSTKVLRIMAVVIVLPIAVLTALAIPEHCVLQKNEIIARGFGWSSPRTYRYAEAKRMTVVEGFRLRDGTLKKRAGIVLDFAEGSRWSSAEISDFTNAEDPAMLDYLIRKTGLHPRFVKAEEDI